MVAGDIEIPLFERKLDQAEAEPISRHVTSDEICDVVRDLPKSKAPGPSSFLGFVFQGYWYLIQGM